MAEQKPTAPAAVDFKSVRDLRLLEKMISTGQWDLPEQGYGAVPRFVLSVIGEQVDDNKGGKRPRWRMRERLRAARIYATLVEQNRRAETDRLKIWSQMLNALARIEQQQGDAHGLDEEAQRFDRLSPSDDAGLTEAQQQTILEAYRLLGYDDDDGDDDDE